MITNDKYSIFEISGGLGKHVAATAVAQCIKNNFPDRELIVVCAYPEVFLHLPFVSRVYRLGNTPYFYQNYIKDKEPKIFKHEPYFTDDHINKKLPLIENWCKLYNLTYNGEMPILNPNIRQYHNGLNKWVRSKPIFLINTNGGPLQGQPYPYSWARDIPYDLAVKIVEPYKQTHHIIQICREGCVHIPGVEVVDKPMSNMELFTLLLRTDRRVLIDSSLQHAAKAFNLTSTVLWVTTSPKLFGYDTHFNIVAKLPDNPPLPDSYLFDYGFQGPLHECPLFDLDIFDIDEIISSINSQKNNY
jgi:hypothetical protein